MTPSGRFANAGQHVLALLLFAGIAVAATYPTARHLRTALPGEWRDQYQRACDVELNTWILDWDARAILAGNWRGYWDGNIFHPARGVLAYSEHLLGAALLGAPVYAATGDPVLLYNVLFFLSFALSGYAAAALARDLTGRWDAAIVAGLVFGFCPFRFGHVNHLHLLTAYGAPIALWCGRRFLDQRSWASLAGFVGAVVVQCWTSLTLGVFLLVLLALVGGPAALRAGRRSNRRLLPAAAVTAVVLLATQAPIAFQYWRIHRDAGFARSWTENVIDSADVLGYAAAPRSNRWLGGVSSDLTRPERWLYPGIVACAFAWLGVAAGAPAMRRQSRWSRGEMAAGAGALLGLAVRAIVPVETGGPVSWSLLAGSGAVLLSAWLIWTRAALGRFFAPGRDDAVGFYAAWTIVAAVLSCGPILHVSSLNVGYGPYALLYKFLPGLSGLRAPVRLHLYAMLGVAVLAAYGAKRLAEAHPRRGTLLLACGAALVLIDSASVPLPLQPVTSLRVSIGLEQWLAAQPPDLIFAALPLVPNNELWRECDNVFASIYHHKRIVNGYSGFFPREWHWLREELQKSGVSDAVLDHLLRASVTHVSLPAGSAPPPRLTRVADFDHLTVYALRPAMSPITEAGRR